MCFPGGEVASVGFNFSSEPVPIPDISSLRFRRDDCNALRQTDRISAVIEAAYFPLIAVLIPKWLETISSGGRADSKKIVFLISGRGTPIDANARVVDNSTKSTGSLISKFIEKGKCDVFSTTVHSVV